MKKAADFQSCEMAMRCCLILESRKDIDWTKPGASTKAAEALCERFGFSTPTGFRYAQRYRDAKGVGLVKRKATQVARVRSGKPHPWKAAHHFMGVGSGH